jgi:hypothetical protein
MLMPAEQSCGHSPQMEPFFHSRTLAEDEARSDFRQTAQSFVFWNSLVQNSDANSAMMLTVRSHRQFPDLLLPVSSQPA